MRAEDLRAFVERDWRAVEREKERYWRSRMDALSVSERLALSDQLREQALAWNPAWPSHAERQEDLATHIRVSACLARVRTR